MPMSEREARNLARLLTPKAGDYWREMFTPVAIVISCSDSAVTLCRKKVYPDCNHWAWDANAIESVSRSEFSRMFRYDTIPDKTWADVSEKSHIDMVNEFWPELVHSDSKESLG